SPFYISDRRTYNWQDELMNSNAINQAYDVKISGATERVNYYVSAGYFNQEGIAKGADLTRYTASLNLSSDITDWLEVGVLYKYSYQGSEMNNRGTMITMAEA